METIGFSEVIGNLMQTLYSFLACNKAAVDAHKQSGDTESASSCGYYIGIILGIDSVHMNSFPG